MTYDFNKLLSPAFSKTIPKDTSSTEINPSTAIPVDIFKVDVMAFLDSFKDIHAPLKPINDNQAYAKRALQETKQNIAAFAQTTNRRKESERRNLKAAPRQVNIKF